MLEHTVAAASAGSLVVFLQKISTVLTPFLYFLVVLNSVDLKYADPTFTFFAAVNESTTLFGFFDKAVSEFIGPLLS